MLKPTVTIDTAAMQRHIDLLENSPAILAQATLEVSAENEAAILDTLSTIPPRNKGKVEWETEKQRRAYFATDGFGKGIPYVRRGRRPMGWRVNLQTTGAITTIAIENIWNAARYVFGNLIGDPKGTQQKMHANTGWVLAAPRVSAWFTELNQQIFKRYQQRLREARRR